MSKSRGLVFQLLPLGVSHQITILRPTPDREKQITQIQVSFFSMCKYSLNINIFYMKYAGV